MHKTHASFHETDCSVTVERVYAAINGAANMSSSVSSIAQVAQDEHAWLLSFQRSPSFWSFAVSSQNAVLNLETQKALLSASSNFDAANTLLFFAASTAARRVQSEWDNLNDSIQSALLSVPFVLLCHFQEVCKPLILSNDSCSIAPWFKMLAVLCADTVLFAASSVSKQQIAFDVVQSVLAQGTESSFHRLVFLRMLSEEADNIISKFNSVGARARAKQVSLLVSRTIEPMISLGVPLVSPIMSSSSAIDVNMIFLFLECFDAYVQTSQGPGIAVDILLKVPVVSSIMTLLTKSIAAIQQQQEIQTSLRMTGQCFAVLRHTMCAPKQERSFRTNPSVLNEGFGVVLTAWQNVWSQCVQSSPHQQAILNVLKEASATIMSMAESFFAQLKTEHRSAAFQVAQMLSESGSYELCDTCFAFFGEVASLKSEESPVVIQQFEPIQRSSLAFLQSFIVKVLRPALGESTADSFALIEKIEDIIIAIYRIIGIDALLSLLYTVNAGGTDALSTEAMLVVLGIVAPECNRANRVVVARTVLDPLFVHPVEQSPRLLVQTLTCIGNYRTALPELPSLFSNSMRIVSACLTSPQLIAKNSVGAAQTLSCVVREKKCLSMLSSQTGVQQMCEKLQSSISALPTVAQQKLIFSLCRIANASSEGKSIIMSLTCSLVSALDSCSTNAEAGRIISAIAEIAASFGVANSAMFQLLCELHAYLWPHIVSIIQKLGPAALAEGNDEVTPLSMSSVNSFVDDEFEDDDCEFDSCGSSSSTVKSVNMDCVQATVHLLRMEFLAVPMESMVSFVPVIQQMMELFLMCPRSSILVTLAMCLSMIPESVLPPTSPSAKPFIDFLDRTALWFSGQSPGQASVPVGNTCLIQAYTDLLAQYIHRHPVMFFTCCTQSCTVFNLALSFLKNPEVRQHVNCLCSVFSFLSAFISAAPPASICARHVCTENGGYALLDELVQCLRSSILPDAAIPKAASVIQALVERHSDFCSSWFNDIFCGIFAQFRERFLAANGHGNSAFTEVLTSFIKTITQADDTVRLNN